MDDRELDEQIEAIRQQCRDHCGRGWAWAFLMFMACAVVTARMAYLEHQMTNRPVFEDEHVVEMSYLIAGGQPNRKIGYIVVVEDKHGWRRHLDVPDHIGDDWYAGVVARTKRNKAQEDDK